MPKNIEVRGNYNGCRLLRSPIFYAANRLVLIGVDRKDFYETGYAEDLEDVLLRADKSNCSLV